MFLQNLILFQLINDKFRSFINVYKSPQMQTMDDKAALVEKLLNWLNGELQQEKEWQSTSNEALVHAQVSLKNFRNSILSNTKRLPSIAI